MDNNERYYVILGMKRYGGCFCKALGEALAQSDEINSLKIEETWPEYWKQYLKMGKEDDN